MVVWDFLLILLLVGLNAFFVSVEYAVIASRRSRIEILADEGNDSAKLVKSWLDSPPKRDRLIAASQVGITILGLALGALGENTFEELLSPYFNTVVLSENFTFLRPVLDSLPLFVSLVSMTTLVVVLGEMVPKVATLHQPERVAVLAAQPMRVFSIIFKWFIDLLDWSTRVVLRIFGLRLVGERVMFYSVSELREIISESEEGGVLKPPEREMLESVFDFGELLVRQVMIPRTEVLAIEANMRLEDIIPTVVQQSYTKLPVYEDDLDQVIGILHVKDMLRVMNEPNSKDTTARQMMRETIYFPESLPVNELLHQFRHHRQHIAIVLDEYGGTAGLVTLEDLLEEIVGEVGDPFDEDTPEIQTLPDGTVLIDGLTLIETVNQQLVLNLSDPHYDTIAGYFLGKLGHIPEVGENIESGSVRLQVESMDGLRIAQIKLIRLNEDSPTI